MPIARETRFYSARPTATLLLCATLAACGTAPSADLALTKIPVSDTPRSAPPYLVAAGDELDIKFADAPLYDQTAKVLPDGRITLKILGTMEVAGASAADIESKLGDRYKTLVGSDQKREYLIHANDELDVKFPYYLPLNEQMRVRPDGKVQLQLVGVVQAEGLSPEELQSELQQRYAHYLKEPELTVIVRNPTSQAIRTALGSGRGDLAGLQPVVAVRSFQTPQVFVTGEVGRPGLIPYTPGLTLLQAIAAGGGNLPSGDVTKLVILRRSSADSSDVLRPHLTATFRSAPTRDVILQPFDVLILPPSKSQSLAESLDRYVYKLIAPVKNSTFGYVYGATKVY